jgi:hypothetical protein
MEIWDGEHLSELALSCLADGQDVIDPVARVHAESCAACAMRIGAMALESHDVGAALKIAKARATETQAQPVRVHRFPTLLVAACTLLAIGCGVPALVEELPRALDWALAAPHVVPILTTMAVTLTKGSTGAALSLVTTFTLALIGLAIARASSRGVAR